MVERKPHKHAVAIKAWADGAGIETKQSDGMWREISWPGWYGANEYRVKPEPVRDYRMYIMQGLNGVHTPALCIRGLLTNPADVEGHPGFIKWVHTEWQNGDALHA